MENLFMKKMFNLICFSLFGGILAGNALADNPIIQTKFTADPAPLVHDGVVYLYTTHDEDDAKGFKMFDWMLTVLPIW